MPKIASGKRYAQAAFELALDKNELEPWQEALQKIAHLTGDADLMPLLQNPRTPFETKKDLLKKHLGEISPLALNLALLLTQQGLLRLGPSIAQQYHELLDLHRGIKRAQVMTALPLDEKDQEAISRRLEAMVQGKVVVTTHVVPSIIGGFIARTGDVLIDGSVHRSLEALKKTLA